MPLLKKSAGIAEQIDHLSSPPTEFGVVAMPPYFQFLSRIGPLDVRHGIDVAVGLPLLGSNAPASCRPVVSSRTSIRHPGR